MIIFSVCYQTLVSKGDLAAITGACTKGAALVLNHLETAVITNFDFMVNL